MAGRPVETDTERLSSTVALVTGASAGIGRGLALALGAEGARVVLVARRQDRLEDVADRIQSDGGNALAVPTDVTDQEQAEELIRTTREKYGRLDLLVNNAGVVHFGSVDTGSLTDWNRMVQVNLLGVLYTTHAALPVMQDVSPHARLPYDDR